MRNKQCLITIIIFSFIYTCEIFGKNVSCTENDSSKIFLSKLIGNWEGDSEWSKSIMLPKNKALISFSCKISDESENEFIISFKAKSDKLSSSGFLYFENNEGKLRGGWFSPVIDENKYTFMSLNCVYENGILYVNKLKNEFTIGNSSKLNYSAKLIFENDNKLIVDWVFSFSGVPFNSFDNKYVEISFIGRDIFNKVVN